MEFYKRLMSPNVSSSFSLEREKMRKQPGPSSSRNYRNNNLPQDKQQVIFGITATTDFAP
jgi:hypothetical protein